MIVELFSPISVLINNGYKQNEKGDWIKIGGKRFRYHAYVISGTKIEIHVDKLFYDENGKPYHSSKGIIRVGWTDLLRREIKKLRKN